MRRSLCFTLLCFVAACGLIDAATAGTVHAADTTDEVSALVADAELIAELRDRYTRNGLPPLDADEQAALHATTGSVMRRAELLGAEAAVTCWCQSPSTTDPSARPPWPDSRPSGCPSMRSPR